jgi:thioester reductase-like protein
MTDAAHARGVRDPSDARVLLTGFPGFLGSALLPRLIARGDGPVACLVQPQYVDRARERASELLNDDSVDGPDDGSADSPDDGSADSPDDDSADSPDGNPSDTTSSQIQVYEGDITEPDLGLGSVRASLESVDELYHLAAVYDLAVEQSVGEAVNVRGTEHVLEFAREADIDRLHYVSTCYVSGRYEGVFTERHLREGQSFNNYYESTKYRAELRVRAAMADGLPATVYRPAIVVGDSQTGATDKFDGPYNLFRLIDAQPSPLSVVSLVTGAARTELNVVPRDYVVEAIAHLSGRDDTVGETYQLCDPAPPTVPAFVDAVADAMGHRTVTVPVPKTLVRRGMAALQRRGIAVEPATVDYFDHPTRYANPTTQRALAGTGLSCPPFAEYVDRLVDYYREHPEVRIDAMQ